MKIETIPVKKILISDVSGLDPVHVYLEDSAPGRGGMVVKCYNKSWAADWGAIGKDRGISSFVQSSGVDYLVNSLSTGLSSDCFSLDALINLAKKVVLGRRRESLMPLEYAENYKPCSKDVARDLFSEIDELKGCSSIAALPPLTLERLFGDEWWNVPYTTNEPNPDYVYLSRIVGVVQSALTEQKLGIAPAAIPVLPQGAASVTGVASRPRLP